MSCSLYFGSLFVCVLCFSGSVTNVTVTDSKFEMKFSWKQLSYDWPNSTLKQTALEAGQYIPINNLPLGIARWKDRIFITVPRYNTGIASSLNYIDAHATEKSPKLKPYPGWEENFLPLDVTQRHLDPCSEPFKLGHNSTLVSAMRLEVDACDRLWVIDSGFLSINEKRQLVANAIVIFDLKTSKLLRRYNIPRKQTKDDSSLVNIIVEVDPIDCENAWAYVPDISNYQLIVYSYRVDRSFNVKHNYFSMDPQEGDFNVDGVRFQWDSGIFGMAVGPSKPDASRDIYFHALSSYKEYKVPNRVLQNETYATTFEAYDEYEYLGTRGMGGQSTAEAYDAETGVLFYTLINKDAIGCWNPNKFYSDNQVIVASDPVLFPYPNDMKIDAEANLWVLSNRLPTEAYKGLDPEVENYVIVVGKTRELIKGTICEN